LTMNTVSTRVHRKRPVIPVVDWKDLVYVVNHYHGSKELDLGLRDAQRVDLLEYLQSI